MQSIDTSATQLRRTLLGEVAVGVVINALLIPAIMWLADARPPATFGGADGILSAFVKATVFQVFAMTLVLTVVLRLRIRKGAVAAIDSGALPWRRFTPRHVITRAFVFTLAAMATLMPIGVGICALFELYPLSKAAFAAVNVGYGASIGVLVTPFVALAAMADTPVMTPTASAG